MSSIMELIGGTTVERESFITTICCLLFNATATQLLSCRVLFSGWGYFFLLSIFSQTRSMLNILLSASVSMQLLLLLLQRARRMTTVEITFSRTKMSTAHLQYFINLFPSSYFTIIFTAHQTTAVKQKHAQLHWHLFHSTQKYGWFIIILWLS